MPSTEDSPTDAEMGTLYFLIQYNCPYTGFNSPGKARLYVENTSSGTVIWDDGEFVRQEENQNRFLVVSESSSRNGSLGGDEIHFELDIDQTDSAANWRMCFGASTEVGHRHQPLPGIIEKFNDEKFYPEDLEVYVYPGDGSNGVQVGTIAGGNEFRESFDVRDVLEKGAMNRIEVKSTSLGNLQAWVEGDCYRIIQGDG